jgi:hypothetical protein
MIYVDPELVKKIPSFKTAYNLFSQFGLVGDLKEMESSDLFLVYFGPGEFEASRAADTQYGLQDKEGTTYEIYKDLSKIIGQLKGGAKRLVAIISINTKMAKEDQNYVALAQVIAHEFTAHAKPFYAYIETFFSDEMRKVLIEQWEELVTKGSLSEVMQHKRLAAGNPDYSKSISAMAQALAENKEEKAAKQLEQYMANDIAYQKKLL